MTNNQTQRNWITEGIMIAAAPVLAYTGTFAYEAGFGHFFEIPLQFVSLNLTAVLYVGGVLLLVILTLIYPVGSLLSIITKTLPFDVLDNPVFQSVFRNILRYSFLLVGGYLYKYNIVHWWVALGIAGIGFHLERIFHFIYFKKTYKLEEEFDEEELEEIKKRKKLLYEAIVDRISEKGLIIITLILLVFFGVYFVGRYRAVTEDNYLVLNTCPERVVLRIYGDKLITVPFDRKTKTVSKSFLLLKVAEGSTTILRPEKVGPLSPKEK